jgi:hypothetical protein
MPKVDPKADDLAHKKVRTGRVRNDPSFTNIMIGAVFGLITMIGLAAFAFMSAHNPQLCSSFQFQLLAGCFALGAALAGGFIGGGAGAQGQFDGPGFNIMFGLTGGAALLIIGFVVFSYFAPQGCERARFEQLEVDFKNQMADLTETRKSLATAQTGLTAALAGKAAADDQARRLRAELDRLVDSVGNAFPGAQQLSARVSGIYGLISQACDGGRQGEDPRRAPEIRGIVDDAVRRVSSAGAALESALNGVPADLKRK